MDINLQLRLGLVNQFIDRYIQATVKKSFDDALHNNTLDRVTEYLKGNLAVQSKIMAVTINTAYPDVFYSMYDIMKYVDDYIQAHVGRKIKEYFEEQEKLSNDHVVPNNRYTIDKDGNISYYDDKGGSDVDYLMNDTGEEIRINDTSILHDLMTNSTFQKVYPYSKKNQKYYKGHYTISDDRSELEKLFFWLSKSTTVEWVFQGNKSNDFGTKYLLGTLHNDSQGFMANEDYGFANRSKIFVHRHSHYGTANHDFQPSDSDRIYAKSVREFNSSAKFSIYSPLITMDRYNNAMKNKYYFKKLNYEPSKIIPY